VKNFLIIALGAVIFEVKVSRVEEPRRRKYLELKNLEVKVFRVEEPRRRKYLELKNFEVEVFRVEV
jgi:hypothetical protein